MVSKSEVSVKSMHYYDINANDEVHHIGQEGMDFSIEWTDNEGNPINNTVGIVKIQQFDEFKEISIPPGKVRKIPIEKCNADLNIPNGKIIQERQLV